MPDCLYEKKGRIAIFTLNRPERHNALGQKLQEELRAALADFTNDPGLSVGIVTGAGEKAFSAGADLKEMAERQAKGESAIGGGTFNLSDVFPFLQCPKPVIAAVNGLAIGGGMEQAMDCDIRICSENATFGLLESKRGIVPGYGIHSLTRLIPFGEAMWILLLAETIDAKEAHRIGFVHKVVPFADLMPTAIQVAETIAENAPLALQAIKNVANFWRKLMLDESYRYGDWVMRAIMESEDAMEGPLAFAQKRKPVWKGK